MNDSALFLAGLLAAYIIAGRLAMRWSRGKAREIAMALLNLVVVFRIFFYVPEGHHGALSLIEYIGIVLFFYIVLRICCAENIRWLGWLAFSVPIVVLILTRYSSYHRWDVVVRRLLTLSYHYRAVGISYLAFRCSRLVLEVRNGSAKMPGICEYLNFALFLPTIPLGPINTYENHRRGFGALPWEVPVGRAALRILVGLVKYEFVGGICDQLAYTGLLRNGHLHHWIDLPVAMVFYYLYLYCNFSGFCDMAIGAAALIGIPVLENFNYPFAARNIKDFWNRWHITLSQWMRDIVFGPLSKALVHLMGSGMANHAMAIAITVVFILVGIWHGTGWNFFLFGLAHSVGMVANHYYTIALKKWLGREGFKAYMENRMIHAAATVITFAYCAATLLFFANTIPQIKEIFRVLR
jgi:D-alanyl-lipoteichoic acid acyltransferase DltB (MBOAT superfamily)